MFVEKVHFETKNSTQKILSANLKNLLIAKWHIKTYAMRSTFNKNLQSFKLRLQ